MRRQLAVLTVAAAAFLLVSGPTPVAAQAVIEVGWWTRLPTTSAPDGGFTVGSAPDGPHTVAALRLDVGAGVTSLTISAAEDAARNPPAVDVCVAEDGWVAEAGGAFSDAPAIDCTTSVAFEDSDGTWSADVGPLVAGRSGSVSVGFVAAGPANDPLGVTPSSVSFGPPTVTSAAPVTTTSSSTPTTTSSTAPTTTASPPPTSQPATASPAPTPPVATQMPTTTDAPLGPATTTTTLVNIGDEQAAPPMIRTTTDRDDEGGRVGEAANLVLISAAIGVAVGAVHRLRFRT